MFSEKEAKPIMARRLFTIYGGPGQLKSFRKLGFQTFHEVLDESFDSEPNDEKRLAMLLDSMEMLCKEDPRKVYEKIKPTLEHNYNHFISRHWNDDFVLSWEAPLEWQPPGNL